MLGHAMVRALSFLPNLGVKMLRAHKSGFALEIF